MERVRCNKEQSIDACIEVEKHVPELCETICISSSLTNLGLSWMKTPQQHQMDEALKKICCALQQSKSVTSITFWSCFIRNVEDLVDVLVKNEKISFFSLGHEHTLVHLDALECNMGLMKHLKRFAVESVTFSHGISTQLCRAVANNSFLTHLELKDCNIQAEGFDVLAKYLQNPQNQLIELDLADNPELHACAKQFVSFLGSNTKIQSLHLSFCALDGPDCVWLCEALQKNTSLTHLNVAMNRIGCDGMSALQKCLTWSGNNSKLRRLNVAGNKLGESGAQIVAQIVESNRYGLWHFQMEHNLFSPEAMSAILHSLRSNTHIVSCGIEGAKEMMERNMAMHERARLASQQLVMLRKWRKTILNAYPVEITKQIAQYLLQSRGDKEWK